MIRFTISFVAFSPTNKLQIWRNVFWFTITNYFWYTLKTALLAIASMEFKPSKAFAIYFKLPPNNKFEKLSSF